jgi:VWFA-related protein
MSVVVIAIAFGGCGGTQNRPPALTSAQIAAPLKLCTPAVPPADFLAKPGFVQFAVSVTDASGTPVTGLTRSDFQARAGGQTVPIQYFHEEPDGAPTSIVIVMDLSGLMRDDLVPNVRRVEAVQKLLPAAMEPLNSCDEIAILVFGGNESADEHAIGQTPNSGAYQDQHETPIRLLQPFTTDHRLALMRLADRTTASLSPLYDAIQQGVKMLESAHYQNRALIVITDGVDDTSGISEADLIASIKQSGVPIYAIELGVPFSRAYAPLPFVITIPPIPSPSKTGNTASGSPASGKAALPKPPCPNFKCVDTGTLEKVTAPNGGQLLIAPHANYDASVTLNDELNSIVLALNHGYAIGVVAPTGSAPSGVILVNHRQMKVRAHVISDAQ